ncbi:CelD/BcsL family acetyltransferase involved in cellulose biosynthesis [Novosphingobium chloroacetimidivorans]|uniref:CelD/BcsL family acetyltransferase involved in cellulose biosynthesis n=1 Tax=Novosphingobium chloroacetimidivorans TaxID=1428314 RepID=A0A7W7NWM7_9SPHN|nr:GNAT family N-acetyltransferase [Novosphingobium chloroacetimidivorans]MBB4859733.1 CelD/BcsL family acetyltransferase involved in cellulose biosynthesis [Novosphingobium chloroacetimidivorans]
MATRPKIQHPAVLAPLAPGTGTLACVSWQSLAEPEEVAAWDALALQASEPNPFFESWYLLPSLRHLSRDGQVQLLRFDLDGQLAGLLPIVRQGRYYRHPFPNLANWLHPNVFCGAPLVAAGAEVPFWQAMLRWADENAGAALFLHLRDLPLGGPLQDALEAVLTTSKRQAEIVHREERAMLASDLSPEAYWDASLSGKKRKELRRQANRLADEGAVQLDRSTDSDGLEQWIHDFLRLEQAGWKGQAGSALACSPATAALFAQSLAGGASRNRLERLTLTLDGRPIAMLASFLSPPGAFSFKTAFDEGFARFSPGVLLQRENLQILSNPEIAWTDSCAAADHPMIDHIWRERREIGRISIAIGGAARRFAFRQLVRHEVKR